MLVQDEVRAESKGESCTTCQPAKVRPVINISRDSAEQQVKSNYS